MATLAGLLDLILGKGTKAYNPASKKRRQGVCQLIIVIIDHTELEDIA